MRIDATSDGTNIDGRGLRIALVVASFNASVTKGLAEGAVTYLNEAEAEWDRFDAPGAFELPVLAQRAAMAGYDAVVCLGAVIEGDTDHYAHVAHRASEGLMRVQLDTGVPVAFGILTVRDASHAVARAQPDESNKGREAAHAAVAAVTAMRQIDAASEARNRHG